MRLPLIRGPALRTSASPSRIALILPPDFLAPASHLRHRFPPMGPAVVAAAARQDGAHVRLYDLVLDVRRKPVAVATDALLDRPRLHAYLLGGQDDALEALEADLLARIDDLDADVIAFSVDRHTQITSALLVAMALKRRTGRPVVLGGGNFGGEWRQQQLDDLVGLDIVTLGASPEEIRRVFQAAREMPRGRRERPVDPLGGESYPTPLDEWPLPDFSVFDLEGYRRDPFAADGDAFPSYDGSVGRRLFLPYAMSLDCQYACAFCQRGGSQTVRSTDRCVRDLATLAERHGVQDFLFFNSQFNLYVDAFARALVAARLDLHWGDSLRVAPRRPRDVLETMARSGCRQLTFGVESGADRMLKRMVKGHTAQMATAAVQDAHALGIYTRVNLLPCFPGETREDFALTERWVRENAYAIDDISPSAFYMTASSPIGEDPARWGVTMRAEREGLEGDHRFRKAHAPIAYDEIGGMSWEERRETLRSAEHDLRVAWRDGRRELGFGCTQPGQAFALSRSYATKAEAYARVAAWVRRSPGSAPDAASIAALLARPGSGPTVAGPLDVLRREAFAALRAALPPAFTVEPGSPEPTRVTFTVSDADATCRFVLERASAERRAYATRGALAFWYATRGPEPRWLRAALGQAAEALLAPALAAHADALRPGAPTPAREREAFPRWSVTDLVRMGLKPAATYLESQQADPFAGLDDLPAKAVSRLYFGRAPSGTLVAGEAGAVPSGRRMVYVGRSAATVERLRALEESLYDPATALDGPGFEQIQDEFGRLLGFPPCCTRAYAATNRRTTPHADYYASLVRLEAHGRVMDWRVNHVVAAFYQFPFFIHVPCSLACAPTKALVEASVGSAYPGAAGDLVRRALESCAVLFPDDRVVPFRTVGAPDDGELVVTEFNVDAVPQALVNARDPHREVPADSQPYFRDAEVEMLRVQGGRLEAFARGAWLPFLPPGGGGDGPPILVLARGA